MQESSVEILPSLHTPNCQKCLLCEFRHNIVPSYLPKTAQILFLAEGPGETEDLQGTMPLIGKAGMFLNECFRIAGYSRDNPIFGFANVIRCRAVEDQDGKYVNRVPKEAEIKACYDYLENEIAQLQDLKVIVCLGSVASNRLLGKIGLSISDLREHIVYHKKYDKRIVVTYHPAAPLHANSIQEKAALRSAIVTDIQKAIYITQSSYTPLKHKSYVCNNMQKVRWLFEQLNKQEIVSWDTETSSLDYLDSNILCHSFSWIPGTGVTLPLLSQYSLPYWKQEEYDEIFNLLKDFLENPNIKKIAQNGKFDLQQCRAHNIIVQNFYADTLLMHYCINENIDHGLKMLAWLYTDYGGYEEELGDILAKYAKERGLSKKEASFDIIPNDVLWEYASTDPDTTLQLYYKFLPIMQAEGTDKIFFDLYMPLTNLFSQIEFEGVCIDLEYLNQVRVQFRERIAKLNDQILLDKSVIEYIEKKKQKYVNDRETKWINSKNLQHRYSKEEYINIKLDEIQFNYGSTKQLKELFIDQLKLKVVKHTKKENAAFDAEAMEKYAKKVGIAKLIAEVNKVANLLTTFLDGIADRIRKDNKIHTSLNIQVADTGRLCVASDTLLDTDKGCFKISELTLSKNVEHMVYTHTGCQRQILNKFHKGKELMYKVVLDNSNFIVCTRGHQLLTPLGWRHLYELTEGSEVCTYKSSCESFLKGSGEITINYSTASIIEIKEEKIQDVWDIEVEGDHSYCAQGFINHNSSSNPNLQNVPNRTNNPEESKLIRDIFIADSPDYSLVEFDMAQNEFRQWAQLSQDPIMIRDLANGLDIHTEIASEGFKVPKEKVTKDQRNGAKGIVFGKMFGRGNKSVAEQLNISIQDAEKIETALFSKYKVASAWLKQVVVTAKLHKYVNNLFGFRRHLKGLIDSHDPNIRAAAERVAVNSPIQGGASQMVCYAMLKIDRLFKENNIRGRLLFPIHDAIVFSIHVDDLERAIILIKDGMLNPHPIINVPLGIDGKIGYRWGTVESVK